MRAADRSGSHYPDPKLDSTQGLETPQFASKMRYEEPSQMRHDASTNSNQSSRSNEQRAAGGEEPEEDEGESNMEEEVRDQRAQAQLPMEPSHRVSLEVVLANKEREVSHLVDEMQRLQSSINNLKEMSTTKISQLQELVTEKDRVIKELAEKLLRQQDYSDLKRELRLLKSLELGGWQTWCPEKREIPSPQEIKQNSDGPENSNGQVVALTGEDSRSPISGGGLEEPGSIPTPPVVSDAPPVDGVSVEQLQHCLRMNVDRFSNESLNTLSISRCVRELLSMNNIGQRLFAKLVLGLSQGTVSELLSKPKPWDKLTEKGRDSYRKMHAWACDQHCISLLKALLPRKGRESGLLKVDSSGGSEERTTQLTSEAQNAVIASEECPREKNELGPAHQKDLDSVRREIHHATTYPEMMNGNKAFHYGPDFPPLMLAHIYQEELVKLIGKRIKEGYTDDHMKQAQDDIRQALSIYHRELALLVQSGPVPSPESLPSCHSCSIRRPPDCAFAYCRDPPCCLPQENSAFSFVSEQGSMKVMSPYSGTSPLVPLTEVPPPPSDESSPLQRMQSITNSLLSQTSTPNFNAMPQRPMKAVLPPITQQQFDQYNNLNTEDIVKRVKEQLSQYSISQRLFGENVLGLSQGSVSDLLARPKPWHMLTQKGREPFIRMKMFLEDENAVHKLVASQYKIAPERLMRMGGYGGVTLTPAAARYSPLNTAEPSYPNNRPMESRQPTKPAHPASPQPPSTPESPAVPLTAHSPSGSAALPSSGNLKPNRRGHARCLPYVQPSVYEMAAVTTDLDTQLITSRIKETLTVHNIGQKLFGEAVLGLSQGSVSELLSKPKPWHMLSIKGREPFIRMQLWLNDPTNVEKLQAIKTERREANKRRRSSAEPESPASVPCEKPPQYPIDLPPVFLYPPAKKPRILFSEEQKEALKLAYTLDPYPSTAVMEFLSSELGLSVRTITNWFHNHRMRLKQQQHPGEEIEPDPPVFQQGIETVTFDPMRFRVLLSQRLAEMCSKPLANTTAPYASETHLFSHPVYRPIQPISPQEQDNVTLDLSMSSQQFPQRESRDPESTNRENARILVQNVAQASKLNPTVLDSSQTQPTIGKRLPPVLALLGTGSSGGSSSKRRKAATPQWVNPGLEFSPDSDLCCFGEDEEYVEENREDSKQPGKHIINGVCVQQTDLALPIPPEETTVVHIEPAPVADTVSSLVPQSEDSREREEQARIKREKNIRRLERALAENEEGWDVTESDDEDIEEEGQEHFPRL